MVEIRPATIEDREVIRKMVFKERLDPTSLNWRHFLVAEDENQVVGIGQIKEYPGCQELGSLVVHPAYRAQGVGAQLMDALENKAGRPLYLLCESKMEGYYVRFGYETITWWQSPLFLKIKLLPAMPFLLFGIRVLVMRKDE